MNFTGIFIYLCILVKFLENNILVSSSTDDYSEAIQLIAYKELDNKKVKDIANILKMFFHIKTTV